MLNKLENYRKLLISSPLTLLKPYFDYFMALTIPKTGP